MLSMGRHQHRIEQPKSIINSAGARLAENKKQLNSTLSNDTDRLLARGSAYAPHLRNLSYAASSALTSFGSIILVLCVGVLHVYVLICSTAVTPRAIWGYAYLYLNVSVH